MALHKLRLAMLMAILATAYLVSASPTIKDGKLSLEEEDGTVTQTASIEFNKKSQEHLQLDHTQELKISFKVYGSSSSQLNPQQALVKLTSQESKQSAFFAPSRSSGTSDSILIAITSAGIEKQIGTQGGVYESSIILGSSSPDIATSWAFTDLTVSHRPGADGNQPPPSQPLIEKLTSIKPEIVHMHRPAAKRAPAFIALLFTGISVVPLLGFIALTSHNGIHIQDIASSAFNSFYGFGFHAGIGGILAVDLIFWLGLNLMRTFPLLLVLEIVTFWFGVKAASRASKAQLKQE